MMTNSPTRVKAALRDEREVEFMPETMIFPLPVSSHSSAEMMNGYRFQKLFLLYLCPKAVWLGWFRVNSMKTCF
jgi:hypothetical protein